MRLDNGESHTARFWRTRRELIESNILSFGVSDGEIGCEGAIRCSRYRAMRAMRVLINPFCKPLADVRFAPKATELLQRREMTRRARSRLRQSHFKVRLGGLRTSSVGARLGALRQARTAANRHLHDAQSIQVE